MSAYPIRRVTLAAISSLLATVLLAALSALPSASLAAPSAQAQPQSMTIPAGGTATIKVRGFCLDFGKPFPTDSTSLNGLATDNVRQALYYAVQKGYTDNNAAQVQEALWYLRDNTWHNADHTIGQEIVDNAASVSAIPTDTGIAINEPSAQNTLTFTATFVPQTPDAFYGDGDLVIRNTGTTQIQFYVPIGARFTVPGSNSQFQDLIVYALQPAGGTPTAAVTSTTEPVATAVISNPTVAPISTPEPLATPTTEIIRAPLPTTGSTEDGTALFLIVSTIAFAFVGFGLLMRFRFKMR